LINRAIAIDPNYADAYAQKARVLTTLVARFSHEAGEARGWQAEAELAADRAIELAPKFPAAHAARAAVYQSRFDTSGAKREYQTALSLAPDDPTALTAGADFLASHGDVAEAVRIADRLSVIEPLSGNPHSLRAFLLYIARRYPEALAEEQLIQRRWPDHIVPLLYAQILMQLGRDKEAPQWLARSDPESKIRLAMEGILSARAGDVAGALAKKAQLQQVYRDQSYAAVAQIDAQLGRKDDAIAELDKAWALKESSLSELTWNPWLDPLRSDPRFTALLRKLGSVD
jgi:tetratricopeptide (TPR) repeat protein